MKDWHAAFKGWQLFLLVTLLFLASYYVVVAVFAFRRHIPLVILP